MVLASFGQLFSKVEMAKTICEIACRDSTSVQQVNPMIDAMLLVYHPSLVDSLIVS